MPETMRDRRPLGIAVAALVVAGAAGRLVTATPLPFGLGGGAALTWLGYAVVWVPLAAGLVLAGATTLRDRRVVAGESAAPGGSDAPATGVRRLARLWRLGFHPLDVFWGFAAGCLARAADASVNDLVHGDTGLHPPILLDGGPSIASLVVAVVGPVIIAPLLEELFFRGMLPHALRAATPSGAGSAVSATAGLATKTGVVLLTSVVFALLHVAAGATDPTAAGVTFTGTLVFGLLAGALATGTGRIGPAIVAHLVFNGIAVLLTWPS